MDIIDRALKEGQAMLSEYESKQVLAAYGIPVTKEILVDSPAGLAWAVREIGFPVVMKGCAPDMAHKTEKGVIRVDVRTEEEASRAFEEITAGMDRPEKTVLVQELIKGKRELVAGMTRDPQFGPAVMFGLGGILTEVLRDVVFRIAPLEKEDALDMMREIKGHKILDAIRGMEEVDRDSLGEILIKVGQIGLDHEAVKEIDINPIIISGRQGFAVDALIVLS